uniref:Uncharacterized protein n=1 Tax=Arundo donax TaxID=35708 RepID=A0A0A9B7K1_ARUDO
MPAGGGFSLDRRRVPGATRSRRHPSGASPPYSFAIPSDLLG